MYQQKRIRRRSRITSYIFVLLVSVFALTGCSLSSDSSSDSEEVDNTPTPPVVLPTASFDISVLTGIAPLEVSFTDTSQQGSAPITEWEWDLGDGTVATEQNVTHTYNDAGDYTVTLTVTTADGSDQATSAQNVVVLPPVVPPTASFDISVLTGTAPLEVSFADTSEQGSSQIIEWEWDLGDGTIATEQNVTHTYNNAGDYAVTLTVTTADGSDQVTSSEDVVVLAPAIETVSIDFIVIGEDGVPLTDFDVSSSSFEIESLQEQSFGMRVQFLPNENDGVVRFEKDGFIANISYHSSMLLDSRKTVTMLKRSEPIPLNATTGGIITGPNGMLLRVPGSSFENSSGETVSGTIDVFMTPVDVSDPIVANAFSGSFLGRDQNEDDLDTLLSYGVFDITFEQNGDELQLIDGFQVVMELPLYATLGVDGELLEVGEIIPFWSLNEETGIWEFENAGQVVERPLTESGLALVTGATHFTIFNIDINPQGLDDSDPDVNVDIQLCNVTMDLIGATVGERYQLALVYGGGDFPRSGRGRTFTYDGTPLLFSVLTEASVVARVRGPNGVRGSTSILCNSESLGTLLSLVGSPPKFDFYNLFSEPNFVVNANNKYEIDGNNLFIGASSFTADFILFDTTLVTTPVQLLSDVYLQFNYAADDADPLFVTATAVNSFGQTQATQGVTFIPESPPIHDESYAFIDTEALETVIRWFGLEGADGLRVYHYAQGLNNNPTFLEQTTESFLAANGELRVPLRFGFLLLEFYNQYGITEVEIRIAEEFIPDTD